jgi:hypothetical protein
MVMDNSSAAVTVAVATVMVMDNSSAAVTSAGLASFHAAAVALVADAEGDKCGTDASK